MSSDAVAARRAAADAEDAQELRLLRDNLRADIARNSKPKISPSGSMVVSVFRSGVPSSPAARGVEKDFFDRADSRRPEGRTSRDAAAYAAPTFGGVHRWIHGSADIKDDVKVRELRIDAERSYVYRVKDWELASRALDSDTGRTHDFVSAARGSITADDAIDRYWSNGMPLSQWMEMAESTVGVDPNEWEVLIAEDSIEAVKAVSTKRVLDNLYDTPEYGFSEEDMMYAFGA